jgi:hypothetical protein
MKSQGTSTDKVTKAMSRARRHQFIFVALLLLLRACSRPLLAGPRLDDIDDGGMVKKRNVASSSPPQLPILSLSLSLSLNSTATPSLSAAAFFTDQDFFSCWRFLRARVVRKLEKFFIVHEMYVTTMIVPLSMNKLISSEQTNDMCSKSRSHHSDAYRFRLVFTSTIGLAAEHFTPWILHRHRHRDTDTQRQRQRQREGGEKNCSEFSYKSTLLHNRNDIPTSEHKPPSFTTPDEHSQQSH